MRGATAGPRTRRQTMVGRSAHRSVPERWPTALHPVVIATGIESGEQLRVGAIQGISLTVSRGCGDHLMRPLVLALNQHQGRRRPAPARIA
jgi:hypothetical protein